MALLCPTFAIFEVKKGSAADQPRQAPIGGCHFGQQCLGRFFSPAMTW